MRPLDPSLTPNPDPNPNPSPSPNPNPNPALTLNPKPTPNLHQVRRLDGLPACNGHRGLHVLVVVRAADLRRRQGGLSARGRIRQHPSDGALLPLLRRSDVRSDVRSDGDRGGGEGAAGKMGCVWCVCVCACVCEYARVCAKRAGRQLLLKVPSG